MLCDPITSEPKYSYEPITIFSISNPNPNPQYELHTNVYELENTRLTSKRQRLPGDCFSLLI